MRSMRQNLAAILIGCCSVVFTLQAQPIKPELDFRNDYQEDQRTLFSTAWYAARQDQITYSQRLAKKLINYPLYPDLEAEWLAYRPRETRFEEALAFVQKHTGTTAAHTVKQAYLKKSLQYRRWHWYEQFGDTRQMPTESRCRYALTLLNSKGRFQEGVDHARSLWAHGRSQPKQCDPLFNRLLSSGDLSEEHIMLRFNLALSAGQERLSKYLLSKLSDAAQPMASKVWQFHFARQTQIADDTLSSPMIAPLLPSIFKQLARHDSHTTAMRFLALVQQGDISDSDELRRLIARYVFLSDRPDSYRLLKQLNPPHLDADISDWLLRVAVREQEWQVIADLSQALIETHGFETLSDKQRYWRGHALYELGDPVSARQQWQALAQERSFYGFMSADLTGLEYRLNHQAIEVDDTELQELASLEGFKRLREWLLLGEPHKANLEWLLVKNTLSQRQLLTAARLAEIWHEPNLAIQASIAARYWNDIALRFPLHYKTEIDDATSHLNIDDSLVMSLARQESAFNEKARSPVGALGLMQLMPSTARSIAKTLGIKVSNAKLLDGDTNLTLGSHYLDTLVTRYDGNTVLAAAAYNAGPYRVDQWLQEAKNCQRIDTWIESIPYNETRHYVQNVLTYRVIYNKLMGRPAQLMQPSETMFGAAPILASMDEQPSEKTNL